MNLFGFHHVSRHPGGRAPRESPEASFELAPSVFWRLEDRIVLNAAPVLGTSEALALGNVMEDAPAPVGAVGTLVSTLVDLDTVSGGRDNVTDVDGDTPGIALTGTDETNGTWYYSTDNGANWTAVGSVSDSQALLLRPQDRLYFRPNADFHGTVVGGITLRAWDQTSGTAGTKVDASTNGGTTPFSAASDTADITVTPVNDAPVLGTSEALALGNVMEDAPAPVGAVGTLVSTLVDLDTVSGGRDNVTDVDGDTPGIALTGTDETNGTWYYSTDNGANWTAVGSVSDSQALLLRPQDRLYFRPNADFHGTVVGGITLRAWDQTSGTAGTKVDASTNGGTTPFSAASDTADITVTPVNDAPVLGTSEALALGNVMEDAPAPVGAVGTLVSTLVDLDTVSGGRDNVTDVDGDTPGIALTGTDETNGTWYYSTDNGANWTAVGSVSDSQALLLRPQDRLYFRPNADFHGTVVGGITLRAWDQTSGTAGTKVDASTNGGTTPFSAASDTADITVTPVNDAPVLGTSEALALGNVMEDAPAPVGAVGTLVSTLVDLDTVSGGRDNVTDVDGDTPGIALTGTDETNGTWYYSTDNGANWTAVGSVSDSQALLLRPQDRLYFRPNADFHGTVVGGITLRAWDQTSGTAGTKVDASTNGGTTPFSAASDTADITVTPVNDAPVLGTSEALALGNVMEDAPAPVGAVGTLVSTLVDLDTVSGGRDNVTDVDGDTPGIALTGTDETNGTWYYSTDNGANWTAVGSVSDSQALLLRPQDRLYFRPNADFHGTVVGGITLRAWDQTSGTAGTKVDASTNGGTTPFSAASDTADITVTPVNDAPVLGTSEALALGNVMEDAPAPVGAVGTLVSTLVDLDTVSGGRDNVTDVDGDTPGIALTGTDETNGTWYYSTDNGANWTAVGSVSDSQALLLRPQDRLYFRPNADFHGTVVGGITLRAWDQTSGTAGTKVDASTNGGTTPFSAASDTADITVTPVNDAPVLGTSEALALGNVMEDAPAPVGAVGTLVSTLVDLDTVSGGRDNVTDVDGDTPGIALTGTDETNGTWYYSTDNGANWTAVGSVSDSQALLLRPQDRLYFRPNADFHGTVVGGITLRAWDQTSGTAGTKVDASTNGGTTPFSAASDTADITVTPVNDAPVLGDGSLPDVNEDDANPGGASITAIFAGQYFDVDGDAFAGIVVVGNTANAATQGRWQYSTDGGANWFDVGAVDDSGNGLALSAATLIRFVPVANFDVDPPPLVVRALDATYSGSFTIGGARELVDTSIRGTPTPIANATARIDVHVVPENDAPTLGDGTLAAINENAPNPPGETVATIFAGQFSDPDTGDTFAGIVIVGNGANPLTEGVWQYSTDNGLTWFSVGGVDDSNLGLVLDTSALIRFVPVLGFNGTPTPLIVRGLDSSYTGGFTVGSSRVTLATSAPGGSTPIAAATSRLDTFVNSVNSPPSFDGGADPMVNEDAGPQTIANWAINVSPGPPDEAGQQLTFVVTGNTNAGLFSAAPQVVFNSNPGEWDLHFTTAQDAHGAATITIVLMDNGGTLLGGDDTSDPFVFTIHVAPVNDAPTLGGGNVAAILEDQPLATINGQAISTIFAGQFADVDAGDTFAGVILVGRGPGDPAAGSWQYSTDGVHWFGMGPLSEGAGLVLSAGTLVRFVPSPNFYGTPLPLLARALDSTYAGSYSTTTGGVEVRILVDATGAGGSTPISGGLPADLGTQIIPVNDPPILTPPPNPLILVVTRPAEEFLIPIEQVLPGPPNEVGVQSIVSVQLAIGSTEILVLSPPSLVPNSNDWAFSIVPFLVDSATIPITLTIVDNGGTANGGVNTLIFTFHVQIQVLAFPIVAPENPVRAPVLPPPPPPGVELVPVDRVPEAQPPEMLIGTVSADVGNQSTRQIAVFVVTDLDGDGQFDEERRALWDYSALERLPELLRLLPDDRYRVYAILEDGTRLRVSEVYVRQGRLTDVSDLETADARLAEVPEAVETPEVPEQGLKTPQGSAPSNEAFSPAEHLDVDQEYESEGRRSETAGAELGISAAVLGTGIAYLPLPGKSAQGSDARERDRHAISFTAAARARRRWRRQWAQLAASTRRDTD